MEITIMALSDMHVNGYEYKNTGWVKNQTVSLTLIYKIVDRANKVMVVILIYPVIFLI